MSLDPPTTLPKNDLLGGSAPPPDFASRGFFLSFDLSAAPLHGLRSRAYSLRQLLRGTAWQGPSVAPLVPRLAGEQTERVPLRKVTA